MFQILENKVLDRIKFENFIIQTDSGKKAPIFLEAQKMLLLWENEDSDVRALWGKMNEWVYSGFDKTYKNLNVEFDGRSIVGDNPEDLKVNAVTVQDWNIINLANTPWINSIIINYPDTSTIWYWVEIAEINIEQLNEVPHNLNIINGSKQKLVVE